MRASLQIKGENFHSDVKFSKLIKKNLAPVCQNYEPESGCICGRKCFFRHVEADERPSKKSKKGGANGSVALLKGVTQFGCVSQDSHLRKSKLHGKGNWDQDTPSNFPRAPDTK